MFLQLLELNLHIPRLQHIAPDELVQIAQHLDAHRLVEKAQDLHALHSQYLYHSLRVAVGGIEPLHLLPASFIVLLIDPLPPRAIEIEWVEIIFTGERLVRDRKDPLHFAAAKPAHLEKRQSLLGLVGKMSQQDTVGLVPVLPEIEG